MTKLSLKMKILAMLGTALLALIVLSTLSLLQERKLIIDARKETLPTAVQTAHSIVAAYKEAADKGAMSVEDAPRNHCACRATAVRKARPSISTSGPWTAAA